MARSAPEQAVRQRARSQAARPRSRDPAGRPADAAGRCLDAAGRCLDAAGRYPDALGKRLDAPARCWQYGEGRGDGWGPGRFARVRSPWTWSRLDRSRPRPATCRR